MSAAAAVTLRRQGAPDLLVGYADAVAALPIGPDARRLRRNAAARLLALHPQLAAWMRPTPARLADLKRTGAWPFLTWCFVSRSGRERFMATPLRDGGLRLGGPRAAQV